MPDYSTDNNYSLTDLIERGNYAYDGFDDLPYEARQALYGFGNGYDFEPLAIYSRFLPFNYPFLF